MDRRTKRRLMIWCDMARMLIIGSVPLTGAFGVLTLGQLYAVAITAGVCTVFFDVAYQSYLPVVVFVSPLRGMRDLEDQPGLEDQRAPGCGVPGHGGRELPDGAGPQLGD